MSVFQEVLPADTQPASDGGPTSPAYPAVRQLQRGFGVGFHLFDGETGELVVASPDQPRADWQMRAELFRQVAQRGRPEFLEEEPPFVVLALPLVEIEEQVTVAAAVFVTRPVGPGGDVFRAAQALGMDCEEGLDWASRQTPWAPESLERVGRLVMEQVAAGARIKELEDETEKLSNHLVATYEEISLLYRLTQNLKISESDEDLGRAALEWMEEVLPAEGLAIQLLPVAAKDESLTRGGRTDSTFLSFGRCPVDGEAFSRIVDHLDLSTGNQPTVVNPPATLDDSWPLPEVRQMIAVPLAEGRNVFGWLAAFNHVSGGEFGTVEASLLNSVGAILGIHSGNIELYRQQSELLAGI
ncbi:MAG: GAF domain-containing protein, partial [Planctomycetota bacterium]